MTSARPAPLAGVVMGSDSDLPTMQGAIEVLRDFGIPFEVRILSAHRTPDEMLAYARAAAGRGLRVIIAGAGGAAHLPGMLASATPLPVIGVPVPVTQLAGMDALLSIVQMPAGVPVATVAIGNARNAGLLAVRILATADDQLRQAMERFQAQMAETVRAKDRNLQSEFRASS
ncbi:MAG: N5-carboxyaminoimidazole ribonucleotide mutase [Thermomicrobiales bacterium]|nr:MAG: N5-carboxyaminoimidazole ribonucleotide mutase [Thermomicrobiales bacterium]